MGVMIIQVAAGVYAFSILGIIAFQVALVAGVPWGHLTQGGRHQGSLPVRLRVAAGVSIILLIGMGLAIASTAELVPSSPVWLGWATVGIQALTTVANWATPSNSERWLWGPISTIMLAVAIFVVVLA